MSLIFRHTAGTGLSRVFNEKIRDSRDGTELFSCPGVPDFSIELLKVQTLISQICQYFFLKKCEKLFFDKNISVFGYKVVKYLTS